MVRPGGITLALGAALVFTACSVDANYGGTQYSCELTHQCPSGQECVAGQCVATDPEIDARGRDDGAPGVDGGPDGAPGVDARPPVDATPAADAATPLGSSCEDVRDNGFTTSGVYLIRPPNPPRAPIFVYCDQTTEGGGWTLVGRSASGGSGGSFGWSSTTGSVDDTTAPYAQDTGPLATFTEALVATRAIAGLGVGERVYLIELPSGFPGSETTGASLTIPATVAGDCSPTGGPDNLRWWGFTTHTSSYFFAGTPLDAATGLTPGGFSTGSGTCDTGGRLDGEQGMILVR